MDMFISGKYYSKGCKRFKLIEEHVPNRLIYIELIVFTIKFNLKVISTEIFISIFRFVHTKTFDNVIVICRQFHVQGFTSNSKRRILSTCSQNEKGNGTTRSLSFIQYTMTDFRFEARSPHQLSNFH